MTEQIQAAPYILAVDIGTTSTKTLIVHRDDGQVLASHSIEYPLFTPAADRVEQDPLEIFQAVISGIGSVVRTLKIHSDQILCVSFSSAMHSLIAVDKELNPLTNCITWADNRSAEYVSVLKQNGLGQEIYARTGTPIHPMSPLLKLMWFRDHETELLKSAYKFIGIKEFVFAKLFGRFVIDHSLASATGLFELEKLDWDQKALNTAGISREQLSEPVPTTYRLTEMKREYANEMGLKPETPFVVGASDGVLANLAVGATEPGVFAVTIGTSGAVRGVVKKPITDPHGRLFCYALKEDFWVVGGPINGGGMMFRWVRDQLATLEAEEGRRRGMDPYDYLTELASEIPAGSEGLIFLPQLAGERAPHWNANARGVFFGFSLAHNKKHMIRSVLEGVMLRIHSVASALEDIIEAPHEIRASGGFAKSVFWRQMMADVTGTPVTVMDSVESSGIGAALLGLFSMGVIDDFKEAQAWIRVQALHQPDDRNNRVYEQLTSIYRNVYDHLKDDFDAISAFQQEHAKGSKP
jgi:gluconokinase